MVASTLLVHVVVRMSSGILLLKSEGTLAVVVVGVGAEGAAVT